MARSQAFDLPARERQALRAQQGATRRTAGVPRLEAIAHLRAADGALCQVVADLAKGRGWKPEEPYEATDVEAFWHDLIRKVNGVIRAAEERRDGS